MEWKDLYPPGKEPGYAEIGQYVQSPLWERFATWVNETYNSAPRIEYSRCGGAPGWNVKYKKGGRALCTLYPHEGYFTCLVCVGAKEEGEVQALLSDCDPYSLHIYHTAGALNGTRWMMMDITTEPILDDVKRLVMMRVAPKGSAR